MRLDESNSGRFLRESLELCMECYYLAERYREKDINEALRSRRLSKYLLSEVISPSEMSDVKRIAGEYEKIKEKITKIKDALPDTFKEEKRKLAAALNKFDITSLTDLILGGDSKKLSAFLNTVSTVGTQVIVYSSNMVEAFKSLTEFFSEVLPKDSNIDQMTLRVALRGPNFDKNVKALKARLLADGPDANLKDALEKGFNFKPGGFGQKLRVFLGKIGVSDGWLTPDFMKSLLDTTIGDLRKAAAALGKEEVEAVDVPDASPLAAAIAQSTPEPAGGGTGADVLPLKTAQRNIRVYEEDIKRQLSSLVKSVKDLIKPNGPLSTDKLKDILNVDDSIAESVSNDLRDGIRVFIGVESAFEQFFLSARSGTRDYQEKSKELIGALVEASKEYNALGNLLKLFEGLEQEKRSKLTDTPTVIAGLRAAFKEFAETVDGELVPRGTITLSESLRTRGYSSNVLGERMLRIAGVL